MPIRIIAGIVGVALVAATLLDAFEVVLLPRPVRHRLRLNHYFFLQTWALWKAFASRWAPGRRREDFLAIYGPLSMVLLFSLWGVCLIVGFALIQWTLQSTEAGTMASFAREIIVSGDAFFTLGYGDIIPEGAFSRILIIVEAGTGFGFIAMTVGYLPVLYQHFSNRDVQLIEFAARAGSPPTAVALLSWHAAKGDLRLLDEWLRDWEHWAGELIESHSTYPMLAFYRSQHDGHSWLGTLAVILDACSVLIARAKTESCKPRRPTPRRAECSMRFAIHWMCSLFRGPSAATRWRDTRALERSADRGVFSGVRRYRLPSTLRAAPGRLRAPARCLVDLSSITDPGLDGWGGDGRHL